MDPQERAILSKKLEERSLQEPTIASLRLFWAERRFLLRAGVYAFLASALILDFDSRAVSDRDSIECPPIVRPDWEWDCCLQ